MYLPKRIPLRRSASGLPNQERRRRRRRCCCSTGCYACNGVEALGDVVVLYIPDGAAVKLFVGLEGVGRVTKGLDGGIVAEKADWVEMVVG